MTLAVISSMALLYFFFVNYTWKQIPENSLGCGYFWNNLKIIYGFTFMLPCIVIDLFWNKEPDALIIPVLFCYKSVHVSGIFCAHHQEFFTVHSPLVSFMQVYDDLFQAESGWNCSFIPTLLGNGQKKPARNLPVPNVQYKTADDGQRRWPKHLEFYNRINLVNLCVWLVT